MKVGVRCCFVVSRPPAKFHRIRSSFDTPTDNYSGSIASLTSDVFGLRKPCRAAFPSLSSQPETSRTQPRPSLPPLCTVHRPLARVRNLPEPDPESRHCWIRIIPKHLQKISVFLFGLPTYLFSRPSDFDRRDEIALNITHNYK